MFIIFSQEAFEELKGKYGKFSELNPMPLENGIEYAVGSEVLEDENFASIKNELLQLPQRELTKNDFKRLNH